MAMLHYWHTQQAISLLCMLIGIHVGTMGCCVCLPSIGLMCMAIGIHSSHANGLLCMPIGIYNKPMDGMLCMPIGIHNNPLAYTTCQLAYACCVCQWAVVYATWHTKHPIHWHVVYSNWETQQPICLVVLYANWAIVYANRHTQQTRLMGIHNNTLRHEQHPIAAYTATRPMASVYANCHTH